MAIRVWIIKLINQHCLQSAHTVSEDKLWTFPKLVPNVLTPLDSGGSFMPAGPRCQGTWVEMQVPGGRCPLLACAQCAVQAIICRHSKSSKWAKEKPQSIQNICSALSLVSVQATGRFAAQLQGVYSKVSRPSRSISNGISVTYFTRRPFKCRNLTLELLPGLSVPCSRNAGFLQVRFYSQSL